MTDAATASFGKEAELAARGAGSSMVLGEDATASVRAFLDSTISRVFLMCFADAATLSAVLDALATFRQRVVLLVCDALAGAAAVLERFESVVIAGFTATREFTSRAYGAPAWGAYSSFFDYYTKKPMPAPLPVPFPVGCSCVLEMTADNPVENRTTK